MKYSEIKETFPDSMLGKELKLIGLIVTRQEIIENAIERYKQRAYGFYKKIENSIRQMESSSM